MSKKSWSLPEGAKVWLVQNDCRLCHGAGSTREVIGNEFVDVSCECLTQHLILANGKSRPVLKNE